MFMFCPKCGSKLKADALFCGECGEEIREIERTNSGEQNVKNSIEEKNKLEETNILLFKQIKDLEERIVSLECKQDKLVKIIGTIGEILGSVEASLSC